MRASDVASVGSNGNPRKLVSPGNDGVPPGGIEPSQPLPTPGGVIVPGSVAASPPNDPRDLARVDQVIEKYRRNLLGMKGVVGVRRGYRVANGWISRSPAIVVTVLRKLSDPDLKLPADLEQIPVDVAPATPKEQLEQLSLPDKRRFDLDAISDVDELVRVSRYVPPPHLKLSPVKAAMRLTCHVSPDAGWPTLQTFFENARKRFTVGMYDFTAPHVQKVLLDVMRETRGNLRILLDPKLSLSSPGSGDNPKAKDLPEDEIKHRLSKALGERFRLLWAAVKLQGKTTSGIFPSAYHLKVAVRDGQAFWLSSGNWQSSNQPDFPVLNSATTNASKILATYNREWHAIVEHKKLASLFESYLEYDMEQAEPLQFEPEIGQLPELVVPPFEELEEARVPPRFFRPQTFEFFPEKPLTIEPLLSPDNYAARLIDVIRSARRTLYIQNQYIKVTRENAPQFEELLAAVQRCIEDGLDVRIIVRDLPDTREQLEALVDWGFDPAVFKVLPGCHTKGVIIDSQKVIIGSHNWSNDGVVYNRDASLLIHDAGVARYYEQVFLFDWARARQRLSFEAGMPSVAGTNEAAPLQGSSVPWSWIYED